MVMNLRRCFSVGWRKCGARNVLLIICLIFFVLYFLEKPAVYHKDVLNNDQNRNRTTKGFSNVSHNKDSLSSMDYVHSIRRRILLQACNGKDNVYVGNNSVNIVGNHLVVDRKHKLVYCGIEKVGSTFWRRVFQIFIGSSKAKSPFEIPAGGALGGHVENFAKIGFDDAHSIFQNSQKFIFVRNPYTRLFSAYIDKLFSPNPSFWGMIGKYVVKVFRKNARNISLQCGHDVTFSEFIKYFVHSEINNKHRDGHFIPMYDHCRPCRIKYDFVGKMETFKQDSLFLLKKFGFDTIYKSLEHFDTATLQDTIVDQVNNLYGYGRNFKNCITFHEALQRLWKKFQIRGMLNKNIDFPFSESQSKNFTKQDLIKKFTEFINRQTDKHLLRKQKQEAVREAYLSVDYKDMLQLREIVRPDCEIFGYDCSPEEFFSRVDGKGINSR